MKQSRRNIRNSQQKTEKRKKALFDAKGKPISRYSQKVSPRWN